MMVGLRFAPRDGPRVLGRPADSARTGYGDQSDLSRDLKDMVGLSITELMR